MPTIGEHFPGAVGVLSDLARCRGKDILLPFPNQSSLLWPPHLPTREKQNCVALRTTKMPEKMRKCVLKGDLGEEVERKER